MASRGLAGPLNPDRDTWQSWRYGYDLESGEAILLQSRDLLSRLRYLGL